MCVCVYFPCKVYSIFERLILVTLANCLFSKVLSIIFQEDNMGQRACSTVSLTFEDVRGSIGSLQNVKTFTESVRRKGQV